MLVERAILVVRQYQTASFSLLQRRLLVSYETATQLMYILEERGIVERGDDGEPRKVL
ncbi:MAG: DNA translocase FtsK [Chloroflexota bacterium]